MVNDPAELVTSVSPTALYKLYTTFGVQDPPQTKVPVTVVVVLQFPIESLMLKIDLPQTIFVIVLVPNPPIVVVESQLGPSDQ